MVIVLCRSSEHFDSLVSPVAACENVVHNLFRICLTYQRQTGVNPRPRQENLLWLEQEERLPFGREFRFSQGANHIFPIAT